jgi:DNA-binding MarR family transcriptional regulator
MGAGADLPLSAVPLSAVPLSAVPPSAVPLSALLSQALVALSIELDNEFEHRMTHWINSDDRQARQGPWLTSVVMYVNCLRFLQDDGITVGELQRRARTSTNLEGMRRWRYLTIEPRPAPGARTRPGPDAVLRPTRYGREARAVWPPLFGEVEQRWQERFGEPLVARLRRALTEIAAAITHPLPDCMPILGYGLRSVGGEAQLPGSPPAVAEPQRGPAAGPDPPGSPDDVTRLSLHALLSRVLLAFSVAFARRSQVSLAISADVVRLLDGGGSPLRALPGRSGVSKEAISMATGFLDRQGYAVAEPVAPPGRGKLVRLTAEGEAAQKRYGQLTAVIEARWLERFGEPAAAGLRQSLAQLVGDGTPNGCPLFAGLTPYPDGWRASVRRPRLLPHFPMVLHRGGFADGS